MSSSKVAVINPAEVLAGLTVQFFMTIGICATCLIIFEYLRVKLPWIYSPKYYRDSLIEGRKTISKQIKFSFFKKSDEEQNKTESLFNPGTNLFSWLSCALNTSDATLSHYAGLEAAAFNRFLKFCVRYFSVLSLCSLIILIPVNVAQNQDRSEFGLHSLSIASIPDGNAVLWVPAVMTSIFVIVCLVMLQRFWMDYSAMRESFIDELITENDVFTRTVLLKDVSEKDRNESFIGNRLIKIINEIIEEKGLQEFRSDICGNYSRGISNQVVEKIVLDWNVEVEEKAMTKRNDDLIELEKKLVSFVKKIDSSEIKFLHSEEGDNGLPGMSIKHVVNTSNNEGSIGFLGRYKSWRNHMKAERSVKTIVEIMSAKSQVLGQNIPVSALIKLTKKLEDRGIHYFTEKGRGCFVYKNVKSISEMAEEIEEKDQAINNLRLQHRSYDMSRDESVRQKFRENYPPQSTVLVTLKTSLASDLLISKKRINLGSEGVVRCKAAPLPSDIHWSNLSVPLKKRRITKTLIGFVVASLVVFYLLPVTAIVGLTDLENISRTYPSLSIDKNNIWIKAVMQQVIPTVLISIFMTILQHVLVYLSKIERPGSFSEQERGVMSKYFYFELFNVLFAFSIGTSLFEVVSRIMQDPGRIISILAETLPQNASFFLNYIVLCTSFFLVEILQIFQVLQELFFFVFVEAKTPRSLFKLKNRNIVVDYSYWYPSIALTFIISLVYSTLYPLISFFSLLYFGVAFVIFRYQFLYVYNKNYETIKGLFSSFLHGKIITGLIIQQITVFCFLFMKQAYVASCLTIIPSLIFTLYVSHSIEIKYRRNVKSWTSHKLKKLFSENEVNDRSSSSLLGPSEEVTEMKTDEKQEQTTDLARCKYYMNPIFHKPLKSLWLPSVIKQKLLKMIEENKKLEK